MITTISSKMCEQLRDILKEAMRYVSLHSDVPDFAASSSSELSYGGYTRQIILWNDLTDSLTESAQQVVFTGLKPPTLITAIGLNRTASGNDLVAYGMLQSPVSSGLTSFSIAAGEIRMRIG